MIQHTYFGRVPEVVEVEAGVVWESDFEGVPCELWLANGVQLTVEHLDRFAEMLTHIDVHIRTAITEIVALLQDDAEFIRFHKDQFPEADIPEDVVSFVLALDIAGIHLWVGQESQLVFDFMMPNHLSEEIICVSMNTQGQVEDVSWEN